MERMTLGRSGIEVSRWCLGTMTYGNQTPEDDAHRQIDMALDAGIDFIDTAEVYPVNPVTPETVGRTEEYIGNWIAASGRRDEIVLATKVSGRNPDVRGGEGFDGRIIRRTVEDSLRRLRTDRIDLYQLHAPMRGGYAFRRNWEFDPSHQDRTANIAHMDDVLGAMADIVAEGKVRAFGLSNESAWGTCRWIDRAEATGGPRVATVQNEYSLLCRLYDTDLAEVGVNEEVTLLAYSPLGAGLLTGKYQGGAVPEGSRMAINGNLGGRKSERVFPAVDAYLGIARRHGLDPVHMALAWQATRPFPICPILGATTVEQLARSLDGYGTALSDEVQADIATAHKAHPMPY